MSSKTVNISVPEELLDQVDELAKRNYASRSDIIRQSLVNQLYADRVGAWHDLARRTSQLASRAGVQSEQDIAELVREARKEIAEESRPAKR